jgi:hypothetical protein
MQITIRMKMPDAAPVVKPTLKEKVEYAGWCLDAGHNTNQAIEFLRKAKKHLEAKHPFEREDSDLLQVIQSALMDVGYYV